MTSDAPITSSVEPEPDLEQEIPCPLCDYNLRGLAEPRCPECGHRSTWEELRNRPPLHPYLFEHHPAHNIWSFFRTLFGSLRPMKFWRSVKPAMPLRTGRLIVFGTVCLLIGLVASGFGIFGSIAQLAQRNAAYRQSVMRTIAPQLDPHARSYNPQLAARVRPLIQHYGSLQAAVEHEAPPISSPAFWVNAWQNGIFSVNNQNQAATGRAALLALCWAPLTFLSLLIFRASMRRARIRVGHVLRCVFYTNALICFYGIYLIAASICISMLGWRLSPQGYVASIYLACAGFLFILAIRLMFAYRLYLRFHMAVATVIASQIIVMLSLLVINMFLPGR